MATRTRRPRGLEYDPELACRYLGSTEPRLGELIARAGPFTMRPLPTQSLFGALAESIVYQQLSGKAAATILGRVVALYHPKRFPGPSDILDTPPDRLRAAGLSTAKTAALRDLAAKTIDGTVPSLALARRMDDEALVERLTIVRGVGRWTVEMLLIFRLGAPTSSRSVTSACERAMPVPSGLGRFQARSDEAESRTVAAVPQCGELVSLARDGGVVAMTTKGDDPMNPTTTRVTHEPSLETIEMVCERLGEQGDADRARHGERPGPSGSARWKRRGWNLTSAMRSRPRSTRSGWRRNRRWEC